MAGFLEHKCKHGNSIEKAIYSNMSLLGFVQRLLDKRCVSFFGGNDKYLLLNGNSGISGFQHIGTKDEKYPLILENCLSYDEIKVSALLSVTSFTEFINNGTRTNVGVVETDKSSIEQSGVIIGLIGARLKRRQFMEYQDIMITKEQNIENNGYGKSKTSATNDSDLRNLWNQFYEQEESVLYTDMRIGNQRFEHLRKYQYFDNLLMKKRYTISFDTLLLESEARGAKANQQVFIHVVGIGLGVWKACHNQEEIFLDTFEQRIKTLLPKLKHIDAIHFSWFKLSNWGDLTNGGTIKSTEHPNGGIKIFLSNRNPADKLKQPEYSNTLLVVSYAWDGNAYPGNEFWMGMLKSTGDSSTACSTLVTELHNPYINKTMVSGNNLRIATEKYGVIHVAEYAKRLLKLK